nr:unnamed protein product [Digitaria exilis]
MSPSKINAIVIPRAVTILTEQVERWSTRDNNSQRPKPPRAEAARIVRLGATPRTQKESPPGSRKGQKGKGNQRQNGGGNKKKQNQAVPPSRRRQRGIFPRLEMVVRLTRVARERRRDPPRIPIRIKPPAGVEESLETTDVAFASQLVPRRRQQEGVRRSETAAACGLDTAKETACAMPHCNTTVKQRADSSLFPLPRPAAPPMASPRVNTPSQGGHTYIYHTHKTTRSPPNSGQGLKLNTSKQKHKQLTPLDSPSKPQAAT